MFIWLSTDELRDAAVAAGEEDGVAFFGDAAGVVAGGRDEPPGHAVVIGYVDARCAAREHRMAADEFDA